MCEITIKGTYDGIALDAHVQMHHGKHHKVEGGNAKITALYHKHKVSMKAEYKNGKWVPTSVKAYHVKDESTAVQKILAALQAAIIQKKNKQ